MISPNEDFGKAACRLRSVLKEGDKVVITLPGLPPMNAVMGKISAAVKTPKKK